MKKRLAVAVLAFSLVFSGCAARVNHITNLPPGVSEQSVKNWYSAVGAMKKIRDIDHSLYLTVTSLRDNKVWTDDASYTVALTSVGRLEATEIEANQFLESVPNDWSQPTQLKMQNYMNAISAAIQDLNTGGVTGIKDAGTLASVNNSIKSITVSVSLILSLFTLAQS
jgi:hypothetical protein